MKSRDEYVARTKTQLDEMNTRLSELEARVQQSSNELTAGYHKQIASMQAQSQAAMAKLDELKTAGENGWEGMVHEMDKVRDAFSHAFSKFKV